MGHLSSAQSTNEESVMGYKEDRKILFHASFTEAEKNRLSILHRNLTEEGSTWN